MQTIIQNCKALVTFLLFPACLEFAINSYFLPNVSFYLCKLFVRITLTLWYRYNTSILKPQTCFINCHIASLSIISRKDVITKIFSFACNSRWMSLVQNLSPNTVPLILSQSLVCLWVTHALKQLSTNKVQSSAFLSRVNTPLIVVHCIHYIVSIVSNNTGEWLCDQIKMEWGLILASVGWLFPSYILYLIYSG